MEPFKRPSNRGGFTQEQMDFERLPQGVQRDWDEYYGKNNVGTPNGAYQYGANKDRFLTRGPAPGGQGMGDILRNNMRSDWQSGTINEQLGFGMPRSMRDADAYHAAPEIASDGQPMPFRYGREDEAMDVFGAGSDRDFSQDNMSALRKALLNRRRG